MAPRGGIRLGVNQASVQFFSVCIGQFASNDLRRSVRSPGMALAHPFRSHPSPAVEAFLSLEEQTRVVWRRRSSNAVPCHHASLQRCRRPRARHRVRFGVTVCG